MCVPWRLAVTVLCLLALTQLTGGRRKNQLGNRETKARHCELGTHTCHKDADCKPTRSRFKCSCKRGFDGDGKDCKDRDECIQENGGCVHTCLNFPGNYTCTCRSGFLLAQDGKDCRDVNECFVRKGGCDHQCVNTLGSYECRCHSGYSLDASGTKCSRGTWCNVQKGCDHWCKTVRNKIECYCRDGYFLHADGKRCIRSCDLGNGGCQHRCNQTAEGPECSCASRYILNPDKQTCTASCLVNNAGCERECSDTAAGPVCSCPDGFQLHEDGRSCSDIDECALKRDGCSHTCENLEGSYACICPPGYKVGRDRKTCIDIDECRFNSTCDHKCVNLPGSYSCHCREGYQKYGLTHCGDIDECAVHQGGCAHACENSIGSYQCTCRQGFKLHQDRHQCIDAAQCLPLTASHTSMLTCTGSRPLQLSCDLQCDGRLLDQGQQLLNVTSLSTVCNRSTGFHWAGLTQSQQLPTCVETLRAPNIARRASFVFIHNTCAINPATEEEIRQNLTVILNTKKRYRCNKRCQVNFLELQCGSSVKKWHKRVKKNKKRHRSKRRKLITAEFELQFNARKPRKEKCPAECVAKQTMNKLNRAIKKFKQTVKRRKFVISLGGTEIKPIKKSFKRRKNLRRKCIPGMQLLNNICVACPIGTFYSEETSLCEKCLRGTYQDEEGKLSCKECPNRTAGSGVVGASHVKHCSDLCEPGTVSPRGKKPCQPCAKNSYQPAYGRVTCLPCGHRLRTAETGSKDFSQCITAVKCSEGTFYNHSTTTCDQCRKGWYQNLPSQDFCFKCPGKTTTDFPGSQTANDCKDRRCRIVKISDFSGILESPNYPGDYPIKRTCTWSLKKKEKRKILIIIPEISFNAKDIDNCGDELIMREKRDQYSVNSFVTCESRTSPIAFTARTNRLWIQFRSNYNNTAGGFSIPYVYYEDEWELLIENIVKDGRLYSSKQHQQIFKDSAALRALMEVISTPHNWLHYHNVSHSMFPDSFFKLITPKVRELMGKWPRLEQ